MKNAPLLSALGSALNQSLNPTGKDELFWKLQSDFLSDLMSGKVEARRNGTVAIVEADAEYVALVKKYAYM